MLVVTDVLLFSVFRGWIQIEIFQVKINGYDNKLFRKSIPDNNCRLIDRQLRKRPYC